MNKAILDTDIFSDIIKGVNPAVAAHAKTYRRSFGHYTVSAVTVMEIVQGYQQKQATRQLQAFLAALPTQEVLSFDEAEAELAGRIVGELERVGRPFRDDLGRVDMTGKGDFVDARMGHHRVACRLAHAV